MFGSKDLLFSSEKYGVAKSLRFRSGSTTYLNRTPASAGNRRTFTYSTWVKRGALGTDAYFGLTAANGTGSVPRTTFYFTSANILSVGFNPAGSTWYELNSNQVFRDPSAWYHIVVAVDTTQVTDTNRTKIYVNGSQITFNAPSYVPQNTDLPINNTWLHKIGDYAASTGSTNYFDGYLAEVNFIDGQALTPSSFGFYDNNGIWQPQGYTGTYGTNGFYLKFTDVGATSGANSGYGKDFSGFNTNYWTTNNFGTTSTNTAYDSMYDSPVNASNGITGIGNYPVLNPLDKTTNATITNGNLKIRSAALGSNQFARATMTMPASNIYFEGTAGANTGIALVSELGLMETVGSYAGVRSGVQCTNGNFYSVANGVYTSLGVGGISAGTVIGLAYDLVNNKMAIYKDGVSLASNISISSSYISPMAHVYQDASGDVGWEVNFGQQPFRYSPPSGYSALNTQNLTTPTITNGAQYMAATTYQGTSSTNTLSNGDNNTAGTTFQPDLVWIKDRTAGNWHILTDVVRGTGKGLFSNDTSAEVTNNVNGYLSAFTASGFTVTAGSSGSATVNVSTDNYVAWQWKAGGTGVSNTSGSITSTVSANTSAGFSVVTYTGTGANATVGHGLGVKPAMIIVKARSAADSWQVTHQSLNMSNQGLYLNATNAVFTDGDQWNSTQPTSSVFSLGALSGSNTNGRTYVAYLWSAIANYSSFGSYTGNGSADGPFIYTGFRPRWVMVKRTDTAGYSWLMYDTSRDTYNVIYDVLLANSSAAESTYTNALGIDALSNGCKVRNTTADFNASGGTYIYAAFAENPFKIARAR